MSDIEDRILDKLDSIAEDLHAVRESVVYLRTRDDQHQRDWPIVQDRIKVVEERVSRIKEVRLPKLQGDLVALKTKATIWGGVAGTIVGFIIAVIIKVTSAFME